MLSVNKHGEKLKKINFSKSVKNSMWHYFILSDFFFFILKVILCYNCFCQWHLPPRANNPIFLQFSRSVICRRDKIFLHSNIQLDVAIINFGRLISLILKVFLCYIVFFQWLIAEKVNNHMIEHFSYFAMHHGVNIHAKINIGSLRVKFQK